ncbi:bile acid:sodium symporter family protein [uncultured Ellagibacter sp.]|uniref:bile acid:sodium symporter family protein n=1 Tax=uncultured Ellagibacter sp. TaxID=2137580 RepID=UPI0025E29A8B|nr:bile acid:sodium symporter family protein [uncultured Ellagibacter sp.]
MKVLEKISDFAGKWMAIIALLVAIIAMAVPEPVHAILPTSWVNPLLGIVMFGMGMTLKLSDFKVVFTKPKAVITGILSQFIIMPLIAWVLCLVFQLPTELAVGVMLVGCCPGGTSSNVMTYLSKGDVALSVGMTACTTIMAPVVTPALVLLLAGQAVDVSYVSMLMSIVQVVLVPIALGFVINAVASKVAQACSKVLPLVSVIAISLIIMAVVSANAAKLMTVGWLIIAVVMLHNVCGYALGYGVGRVLGLSKAQMRTLSIEVGMQNSGLATSLATMHFATMPLAAVPGAVFSVWHNISGAIYANILARTASNTKEEAPSPKKATSGAKA